VRIATIGTQVPDGGPDCSSEASAGLTTWSGHGRGVSDYACEERLRQVVVLGAIC